MRGDISALLGGRDCDPGVPRGGPGAEMLTSRTSPATQIEASGNPGEAPQPPNKPSSLRGPILGLRPETELQELVSGARYDVQDYAPGPCNL